MTTSTESPIGGLIVKAQPKAQKKANGHTEEAPCGCRVTISYFPGSTTSYSTKFERCAEHPKPGRS